MRIVEKSEIELLLKKLEDNSSIRRTEKTFTFTAVLTVLGFAFAAKELVDAWFFLLPYFIIVPYSAHITYCRITHARINAYLMEFAPEYRTINIIGQMVPEGKGMIFWFVEILNNYELFLLSIISLSLFYLNYPISVLKFGIKDLLICSIPLILSSLIFVITWYGKRYKYWTRKFCVQWKNIKHKNEVNQ